LKDAAKTKDLIASKFKTKDQKVIDATYAEFVKLMPRDGRVSIDGAKNVIEQLTALKVPVTSTKVEDYVDPTVIDDLAKEGFLAKLDQTYGNTPAK
jgi:hypothetical protein